MLIEHGDVVGFERACLIEACERLVVALERMQDLTEIGPGAARARIDLDGGREQAMRFAHAAELRLDGAEHIERIEMIRRRHEHQRIDILSLAQPALALRAAAS